MDNVSKPVPVKVPLVTEPWGILKSLSVARRNVLELIPEIATRQPIVSGKVGKRWHMVMDPTALKRVLRDAVADYPKSDVTKNILRPAIGDSLFIAEGVHWHWQRRAAAPVFAKRNIDNLVPIFTRVASEVCEKLNLVNEQVDVFQMMTDATFDAITAITFSGEDGLDRQAVHRAIDDYIAQAAKVSLFDVVGVPTWVPRPGRMFRSNATKAMKKVADDAIEARRKTGQRPVPDLLDLLMDGEDPETKRRMNSAELRDNLLTFIVAGHETTSLTLSWALYLCAFDGQVQEKLRAEVTSVLDGRAATASDLDNLNYTQQVIKEALRLYPPAAFLSRTAVKSDTLCGCDVQAGDTVILPTYALHRNHLLWENPDAFDPDRFAKGTTVERFSYLPFGDGPRVCIGAEFAMVEATIVLATLISKYKFTLVAGKTPEPVMILTLRPNGGIWLDVKPVS
jgi:cytochrome P450